MTPASSRNGTVKEVTTEDDEVNHKSEYNTNKNDLNNEIGDEVGDNTNKLENDANYHDLNQEIGDEKTECENDAHGNNFNDFVADQETANDNDFEEVDDDDQWVLEPGHLGIDARPLALSPLLARSRSHTAWLLAV